MIGQTFRRVVVCAGLALALAAGTSGALPARAHALVPPPSAHDDSAATFKNQPVTFNVMHSNTRYAIQKGDYIRFSAKKVERSYRDPYLGFAKHPSRVEVLGEDEVERLRAERREAARREAEEKARQEAARREAEAETEALLREHPPEPEGDAPPPRQRSWHREGSTDALREKARRLGMDFADLLRAERRSERRAEAGAGRGNAKPGDDR